MQAQALTLRRLLTVHLDPFSVPRRSFFAVVRHFCPSTHREHEKLTEFLQPGEGTDDMYEYAQRVRRTMAEVLAEFKSVQIPVKYVMEVFPMMRERQYSLASNPSVSTLHRFALLTRPLSAFYQWYPTTLQLAVAVVKYKTRLQKPREGIATSWLARLIPGTCIPVRLQTGTLLPPAHSTTPVLAIGPGTGIAPLRSLVYERLATYLAENNVESHITTNTPTASNPGADECPGTNDQARTTSNHPPTLADTLVIFGCRYQAKDCLYGAEWKQWATTSHANLTYVVAASRDQPEKVYVQHRIRENGARIWDILGPRRGIAYLCGTSGKMPEQVKQSIVDVFVEHGHMNVDQAVRYLSTLETERRWQEECW